MKAGTSPTRLGEGVTGGVVVGSGKVGVFPVPIRTSLLPYV